MATTSQRSPNVPYKPLENQEDDVAEIKKSLATGGAGHEGVAASGGTSYLYLVPFIPLTRKS
jgi:hypothetical protein